MPERMLCLGEGLIDIVTGPTSSSERVGGSLLNVAVGIARLSRPASLCAHWAGDPRGRMLSEWARLAGVDLTPGTESAPHTPVAYARIDDEGRASYEFDLAWAVPQPPELAAFGHLHTGSLAATLEPGGSTVQALTSRMRGHGTVSYDPNIRPAVMRKPAAVLERVERLVRMSDVVKASDEDLRWLYPGTPVADVLRRWLATGPSMLVLTRGPAGADALLAGNRDMLHLDPIRVTVADTVGAGDSFMAGLLTGLCDAGLLGSPRARERLAAADWPDVQPALHRAVISAALTVGHSGEYPPTMAEVETIRATDPLLRD